MAVFELCPPGQWNDDMGQNECWPCKRGYFAADVGSVECTACEVDTYQVGIPRIKWYDECYGLASKNCPVCSYVTTFGLAQVVALPRLYSSLKN